MALPQGIVCASKCVSPLPLLPRVGMFLSIHHTTRHIPALICCDMRARACVLYKSNFHLLCESVFVCLDVCVCVCEEGERERERERDVWFKPCVWHSDCGVKGAFTLEVPLHSSSLAPTQAEKGGRKRETESREQRAERDDFIPILMAMYWSFGFCC